MKAAFEVPTEKWHTFKAATARQGLNMTMVLNRMIQDYIEQEHKAQGNGGEQAWNQPE